MFDGAFAVATWHVDVVAGLAIFSNENGRWTLLAHADRRPDSNEWTKLEEEPPSLFCVGYFDDHHPPPSAQELIDRFHIPPDLAKKAADAVAVQPWHATTVIRVAGGSLVHGAPHLDCAPPPLLARGMAGGYAFTLFGPVPWDASTLPSIAAHATGTTSDGNGVGATLATALPLRLKALSLYVWFPYVLDASRIYHLSVSRESEPPVVISGRIAGNAVLFAMPDMTLRANESVSVQVSSVPETSQT